ncbi:hypothetical protein ACOSP7_002241 [Xanthoceras sorbifolium]
MDVQAAEAQAMAFGRLLTVDIGFHYVLIQSNTLVLVQLVRSRSNPLSDIGLGFSLLGDILDGITTCEEVYVNFIPRNSNKARHSLAKLSCSLRGCNVWTEEIAPRIVPFVLHDCHLLL